jgi:hypothetical protein
LLQYKILYFDADGALLYSGRMDSAGDDEALERVAALHHAHAVELWRGEQCVRRFEPAKSS